MVDTLLETTEAPPPSRPAGRAQFHDLEVGPGLAKWVVLEFELGSAFPMHHTDTIDFDTVLSGSIETLDDCDHVLNASDCVLMTGIDHAWATGPGGCQLSVVALGTPAP